MQIGIVGLPLAGKSTLFRLLTGVPSAAAPGRAQGAVGVAKVPDPRLAVLAEIFQPRKVTPADIQFTDTAGFMPGETNRAKLNEFFDAIRRSDALVHVIRGFESATLPHPRGSLDPARDAVDVETELLLADLQVAEKGIERLRAAKKRSPEVEAQIPLLERVAAALSEERPIRALRWEDEEERLLRGFGFLSAKPLVIAVNLDETSLRTGRFPGRERLAAYCEAAGIPLVPFSGAVEAEIAELAEEDRALFLSEYGLTEPGIARVARAAYAAVGFISFLTAGEDEVRAWPIRAGVRAKEAAGKIHSDIEKGFIRAEVVPFEALREAGSLKAARERGLVRLEGRDYVVADGDVINFRFNV